MILDTYDHVVDAVAGLVELMIAIAGHRDIGPVLERRPELANAAIVASEERFLDECGLQLYAGDTALHVAAASHDVAAVLALVRRGADLTVRNRRGAQPLHAATRGGPGSVDWDPDRQVGVIEVLVESGAEVDAVAAGGVTALHRAVRNRCSAAVRSLLAAGADPSIANDRGSTAFDLTRWTTGRGGTGSPAARAELDVIIALLEDHAARR